MVQVLLALPVALDALASAVSEGAAQGAQVAANWVALVALLTFALALLGVGVRLESRR